MNRLNPKLFEDYEAFKKVWEQMGTDGGIFLFKLMLFQYGYLRSVCKLTNTAIATEMLKIDNAEGKKTRLDTEEIPFIVDYLREGIKASFSNTPEGDKNSAEKIAKKKTKHLSMSGDKKVTAKDAWRFFGAIFSLQTEIPLALLYSQEFHQDTFSKQQSDGLMAASIPQKRGTNKIEDTDLFKTIKNHVDGVNDWFSLLLPNRGMNEETKTAMTKIFIEQIGREIAFLVISRFAEGATYNYDDALKGLEQSFEARRADIYRSLAEVSDIYFPDLLAG